MQEYIATHQKRKMGVYLRGQTSIGRGGAFHRIWRNHVRHISSVRQNVV